MEELQSFDVNTGEQIISDTDEIGQKPPKKKKTVIIAVVAVLIVAIAAVIIFLCINPKGELPRALLKTVDEFQDNNKLFNALNVSDLINDKRFTLLIDADTSVSPVGDVSMTSAVVFDKDIAEISGDIDISYAPTVEYTLQFDQNEVRAMIPMIPDQMFVYCYTNQNEGYINEFLDSDYINKKIKEAYDAVFSEETVFDINKIFSDFAEKYKELSFTKIDDEEYTVDGNTVSCKGYETKLNKKVVKGISRNLSPMDMQIYLYDGQVAAIKLFPEGMKKEYEIRFKGGKYRMENMEFCVDGDVVCTIEGHSEGNVETATLEYNGETAGYEYDFAEGDIKLFFDEEEYTAKLIHDERKFSFELDYIDFDNSFLGLTVAITPTVNLSDMTGEEFDIGNATEEEITEVLENVQDTVQGLLGQ